ncbi:hypothetical protein ACFQUU_06350 [Herbaspirillum sp. GCM10030257]|uniref:hypothetical protein n=1 Tax=Herbaspirillum sp. GCM10030257 TaxID=3273393 RepID=UPI0036202A38
MDRKSVSFPSQVFLPELDNAWYEIPAHGITIIPPESLPGGSEKIDTNQASLNTLKLQDDGPEREVERAAVGARDNEERAASADLRNWGPDLKAIRESIAKVEAEAKATVASENRSRAEERARALAEEHVRIEALAAAVKREIDELRARTEVDAQARRVADERARAEREARERAAKHIATQSHLSPE